jgi:malonyl-CoA decarboxylase
LNSVPNGTAAVVEMRSVLLDELPRQPELQLVDADFLRVLQSWFDPGFLTLRRITWQSPAALLEKLIAYEAVHEIKGWEDLRRRLRSDRRCFAFFHPALPDEPLVFVEIALRVGLATAIADLVEDELPTGTSPDSAVFYSITNCQDGLRGVRLGRFLLTSVIAELSSEVPSLRQFATLSPVPGFASWLATQTADSRPGRADLLRLCGRYLTSLDRNGRPIDRVARFHLRNGASLHRINWMANPSPEGLAQSHGLMVNYLYDPDRIEENHEALVNAGVVACSDEIRPLLEPSRLPLDP